MNTPTLPVPKVNVQFWFDYSETLVKNASKDLDNRADKLLTALAWLFGLYTGSSVFSIAYNEISMDPIWIILLALPYAFLIYGYLMVLISRMPISSEIIPENWQSIRDHYTSSTHAKRKRLNWGIGSTVVPFALVGLVLPASFVVKHSAPKLKKDKVERFLTLEVDKDRRAIGMHSQCPTGKDIKCRIQTLNADDQPIEKQMVFNLGKCGTNCFKMITGIDTLVKQAIVELSWQTNDGATEVIRKTITL